MNFIKKAIKVILVSISFGIIWQCQDDEFSKFSIENIKEKEKFNNEVYKAQRVNFSIMSYNVFHLPSSASSYHYKEQLRASGQQEFLSKMFNEDALDVVVVQEAFNKYSTAISNGLPISIEQSGLVGWYCGAWKNNRRDDYFENMSSLSDCSNSLVVVNGGTKIYSKWPILYDEQLIFKNSHPKTWDYWSNKGAAYVKLDKQGKVFHVIGLHLQADEEGDDGSNIRKLQLEELRNWMYGKLNSGEIKANEPIIFAGDFNIPHFNKFRVKEMTSILQTNTMVLGSNLHSYEPNNTIHKANGHQYTPQTLDYILVSNLGKQPEFFPSLSQETIRAMKLGEDLSDHHPVKQRFTFRYGE